MQLQAPDATVFPQLVRPLLASVALELGDGDAMYHSNDLHYLSCGASAVNAILAAVHLAEVLPPAAILDFGAGAGRVTRWLRAAFPESEIHACDLRADDMAFCSRFLGVRTWTTTTDIDALAPLGSYDLIWMGSVVTHLSASDARKLIDKMLSWLNDQGLFILSLHGRFALERQRSGRFQYIHDAGWREIERGFLDCGYGYADYERQSAYGISVTKLSWVTEMVESRADLRLIALSERAWDGHHDILAVQAVR